MKRATTCSLAFMLILSVGSFLFSSTAAAGNTCKVKGVVIVTSQTGANISGVTNLGIEVTLSAPGYERSKVLRVKTKVFRDWKEKIKYKFEGVPTNVHVSIKAKSLSAQFPGEAYTSLRTKKKLLFSNKAPKINLHLRYAYPR